MNILVLQLMRIGDVILTAPALSQIRASFPNARITLVLNGASGQLAPAIPHADHVLVYDKKSFNAGLWTKLMFKRWHVTVDFTGTDRSLLMTFASRASIRISYERYRKSAFSRFVYNQSVEASMRDLSTVDFHLSLAHATVKYCSGDYTKLPQPPYLRFSDQAEGLPQSLPDHYAVIHPGTARDEKYWLPERWAEVAAHIHQKHQLAIVLTGSGDKREQDHLAKLKTELDTRAIPFTDLSGQLSLSASARVISKADIVLSVDSAAMHLAAQFARPQVGLFGPTNPYHWAPTHEHARVILASAPDTATSQFQSKHQKAEMSAIPVTTVCTNIDDLLSKQ